MEISFREAARRHWDDAEYLGQGKRFPNADQLYGLAAECALKAAMVALGTPTTEEGDLAERGQWKHVNLLWPEFQAFATGRRGARVLTPLRSFETNPFFDWAIEQRYAADAEAPSGASRTRHAKAAAACFAALRRASE